jgi:SAM-dependent methyltransferase
MKNDQHVEQYKEDPGARVAGETADRLDSALSASVARFIKRLEDIESQSSRPEANAEVLAAATTEAMTEIHRACEEFERRVGHDATVIRHAQAAFRVKTQRIFSASYFNRARVWPQGYQGDYLMLEYLYNNVPGSSGVGYFLNRYLLATTLAEAVRQRKKSLEGLLKTELKSRKEARILDIACGSCREIGEIAPDVLGSGARITCVDADQDALDFSSASLLRTGLVPGHVEFRKYNALKMVNHEKNLKEFGMKDVIYSVGLFDYLRDDVLIRLFEALYRLLNSGGVLITSLKDSRRYSTFIYHWVIDWNGFLQRTEAHMWELFRQAGIPKTAIEATREQSGVIIFFTILKES